MSWLSKGLKGIERGVGKLIPHQSASERRQQMYAVREQMDFYKTQKEELHKANEQVAAEKKLESDRLHEKQIRSLRRGYRRRGGFMGTDSGAQGNAGEVNDTLG